MLITHIPLIVKYRIQRIQLYLLQTLIFIETFPNFATKERISIFPLYIFQQHMKYQDVLHSWLLLKRKLLNKMFLDCSNQVTECLCHSLLLSPSCAILVVRDLSKNMTYYLRQSLVNQEQLTLPEFTPDFSAVRFVRFLFPC